MKVTEVKCDELPVRLIGSVANRVGIEGLYFYLPHTEDVNRLLPNVIKTAKKRLKECSLAEEYMLEVRRVLKALARIATSKEITEGKMLVSLFCDTYCDRDRQIHTRVINDVSSPEFSEAPENVDYGMDAMIQRLSDEQRQQLQTEEGVQNECVVLRQHQTRANQPFVVCDTCHGSGGQRCPACEGSGREQYVDGYYASGEERIKTGACSTCHGRGQVACPDCRGQGRIEIFAPNYTLEKSVTETWTQKVYAAFASPFIGGECPQNWVDDYNIDDYNIDDYNNISELAKIIRAVFDNDCIWLKMKNRKEILENNSEAYMEELERLGMIDAYQTNREYVKKEARESGIVCIQERHYIIPITRIRINTHRLGDEKSDDRPFDIYVLPQDDKQDVVMVNRVFEGMGKAEYLFTLLFKKRQPWAEIKTKRE